MLVSQGARVSGIALDPVDGGIFELASIHELLEHDIRLDIRDQQALTQAFRVVSPDLVIHLAAQPLVLASYANAAETYQTNVIGTLNVLEAFESTPSVQATLIITTDKVYRQDEGAMKVFVETDSLGSADPYSTSKAMADLLTQAWIGSHPKSRIAIARAGNVIGGGDVAENRLFPDLVRAFGSERTASVRNPDSVRPWQHVLDCLSGYVLLGNALMSDDHSKGAFNFGPAPENPLRVSEVADIAASLWGQSATWVPAAFDQPRESQFLALDSTKSKTNLGWREKLTSKEAIEWTVEWYKSLLSGVDARSFTMDQIMAYLNR
jgi:CDP-glucose 4,6-dehydratase